MDSLGITNPPIVVRSAPTLPSAAQTAKTPDVPFVQIKGADDSQTFDAQAAEQQREQAVQRAAQSISEVFVVSDKTFTIFKDITGQYITRFTSLRDGKVTYIPEPNLLKMAGDSGGSVSIRV